MSAWKVLEKHEKDRWWKHIQTIGKVIALNLKIKHHADITRQCPDFNYLQGEAFEPEFRPTYDGKSLPFNPKNENLWTFYW